MNSTRMFWRLVRLVSSMLVHCFVPVVTLLAPMLMLDAMESLSVSTQDLDHLDFFEPKVETESFVPRDLSS